MPIFSKRSKEQLSTCHIKLQKIFNEVIKVYDCQIIEGYRDFEKQNRLLSSGNSQVPAGRSKHNLTPSLAVDVAPYPVDWKDEDSFYYLAGIVKGIASTMGIKLRYGGDWNNNNNLKDQEFFDLGHFELVDE